MYRASAERKSSQKPTSRNWARCHSSFLPPLPFPRYLRSPPPSPPPPPPPTSCAMALKNRLEDIDKLIEEDHVHSVILTKALESLHCGRGKGSGRGARNGSEWKNGNKTQVIRCGSPFVIGTGMHEHAMKEGRQEEQESKEVKIVGQPANVYSYSGQYLKFDQDNLKEASREAKRSKPRRVYAKESSHDSPSSSLSNAVSVLSLSGELLHPHKAIQCDRNIKSAMDFHTDTAMTDTVTAWEAKYRQDVVMKRKEQAQMQLQRVKYRLSSNSKS